MSKIVSPLPPLLDEDGQFVPPPNASWWRLRLEPNEHGHDYVLETDAEQTWCSIEFFDGESTIIDTGFDRTVKVRIDYPGGWRGQLDVLHEGPPTPSPRWRPLTNPGVTTHPEDWLEEQVW